MKKLFFTLTMLFASLSLAATEVTRQNFEQEIGKYNGIVAIKFYSNECPACVQFEGVYRMAEAQFDKEIKFTQVSVDDFPEFAQSLGLDAIPAVLVAKSKNGKATGLAMNIGAMNPQQLEAFLKEALKRSKK